MRYGARQDGLALHSFIRCWEICLQFSLFSSRMSSWGKEYSSNGTSELGPHDENDRLRIALVQGISRCNPFAYRVALGSDPRIAFVGDAFKRVALVSRIHTMEPSSSENIDHFLPQVAAHGTYYLACAYMSDKQLNLVSETRVQKHKLIVRNAWKIGPNDIDVCAIRDDDDPVIPGECQEAPILEVLERLRSRR